jgi:hypothetical protein
VILSLIATGSCGFPDHTFVNDDEFFGRGASGNVGGTDGSTPSGGSAGISGTGAFPGTGGSGTGGKGSGGIVGKSEGGVPPRPDAASGGSGGNVDAGTGGGDSGPVCPVGRDLCFGVCVDLLGDGSHCGTCNVACTGGDVCKAGVCAPPCSPGLTLCSGNCVDIQTDENHCGGCAKPACPSGNVCKAGVCAIDCGAFTSCIPGSCTDLKTDDKHCGNCATDCTTSGKICSGGVCQITCSSPYILCAGSCVNPQNDNANCNGCGKPCALGQSCIGSVCTKLVENCQNGVDDDKDGLIDCADPDCTTLYTCATTPAGWNGPVAVWSGAAGSGPSCAASGGYPSAAFNANAGLVVPGYTCPACSCTPSGGMFCDDLMFVYDTSTNCANTDPWQAQAFTPGPGCTEFELCCSPPTARSAILKDPLPSYVHGSCTATQGTPQFPATSWTTDALGCNAVPTVAGGCGGGQCLPKPTAPFGAKLCIYRAGIATCPAGYPNQNPGAGAQYYQGVDDNPATGGRSCSGCNCAATCGGTIKTYTDKTCTVGEQDLDLTTSRACTTVPADTTVQGGRDTRSYTFTGGGPTCGSGGPSTLSGAPTPSSAVTVCCQ